MKNKGSFIKGIAIGLLIAIIANSVLQSGYSLFSKMVLKDLEPEQKVKEIQNIIDKYYVNEYDEDIMEEYIYKGIVESLDDKYSYYMTEKEFKAFLEETEGNYVGIGILIGMTEQGTMKINKVFEGSPAEESGLLDGDIIEKVFDEQVTFENYDSIISKIKGEEGTKTKLTVYRPSEDKTFELEVVRRSIDVPTVYHKTLEDDIGYIEITQFDRVTYEQFKEAFEELENTKGLIIDLRNNPGGLLQTVNQITDLLVPEGTITYIEDKNGEREYHYSDENAYNKPLVILVNEYSASASEVLSGAVKDFEVAELVGNTTYGKGVVQNIYELPDGSGVKVTIAKYYTPNGISIDGTGIEPDYKVINPEDGSEDLQLEKAIEVINSK